MGMSVPHKEEPPTTVSSSFFFKLLNGSGSATGDAKSNSTPSSSWLNPSITSSLQMAQELSSWREKSPDFIMTRVSTVQLLKQRFFLSLLSLTMFGDLSSWSCRELQKTQSTSFSFLLMLYSLLTPPSISFTWWHSSSVTACLLQPRRPCTEPQQKNLST